MKWEAALDHLISFVVLAAAGALFWYIGTCAIEHELRNEAVATHPVLVEFRPENRDDGFVMVRDDKTGTLYAIRVERKRDE